MIAKYAAAGGATDFVFSTEIWSPDMSIASSPGSASTTCRAMNVSASPIYSIVVPIGFSGNCSRILAHQLINLSKRSAVASGVPTLGDATRIA
jgi:hypothetical protein